MRKAIISLAAGLLACAFTVHARPQGKEFSVNTGTNDTGTVTMTGVAGYIDEIICPIPAGTGVTGTVAVAATPAIGTAVTLATATIAADKLFRTRLDGTDNAGSALTSDPPGRFMAYGDVLVFTVSSANTTGLTWRVYIKWDDGRN